MESDRSGLGGSTPPAKAILVVGPDRRVRHANSAAETLFGSGLGGLMGASLEELVPAERRGELKNLDEVLSGGSTRRLRSAIRLADGKRIDVTATLTPYHDEHGNVVAATVLYEPARSSAQWVRASLVPTPPPPLERVRSASEPRLSPTPRVSVVHARLAELEGHIAFLEQRMTQPTTIAPLDDPAERARVMLLLTEMRTLVHACRTDLARESGLESIPAPPKVPRL